MMKVRVKDEAEMVEVEDVRPAQLRVGDHLVLGYQRYRTGSRGRLRRDGIGHVRVEIRRITPPHGNYHWSIDFAMPDAEKRTLSFGTAKLLLRVADVPLDTAHDGGVQ